MPRLKSLARLTPRDWAVTLEAYLHLAAARLLVSLVPTRRWSGQLARGEAGETLVGERRDMADRVSRAVRRAARNAPVELVCLPQALAARWMLRRRGIDTQMFFGTRMTEDNTRDFHAWLKVGQQWITGHCNESDYAVFSSGGKVPG